MRWIRKAPHSRSTQRRRRRSLSQSFPLPSRSEDRRGCHERCPGSIDVRAAGVAGRPDGSFRAPGKNAYDPADETLEPPFGGRDGDLKETP
jgi:hypothetical protein